MKHTPAYLAKGPIDQIQALARILRKLSPKGTHIRVRGSQPTKSGRIYAQSVPLADATQARIYVSSNATRAEEKRRWQAEVKVHRIKRIIEGAPYAPYL